MIRLAPLALALTACASASSTQLGPSMYSIECRRSQSNCYEEAAAVCPYGFRVMDGSGQQGAVVVANGYTGQAYAVPTYRGEMLVQCDSAEYAGDPQASN